MADTNAKTLTVKELADAWKVDQSTIYRLIERGRLPYLQPGGKGHSVRLPMAVLDIVIEPTLDLHASKLKPVDAKSGPTPKWMTSR